VIEGEDGFRPAGISDKDFLWKCWLKNKEPPFVLRERARGRLWELSPEERRAQKLEWQHEIHASVREEVALALKTIKTARGELKGLQQISDAYIISQSRVIGCTTTKAAMYKSLLSGIGIGILLVEEAAEIREADVLTRYVYRCPFVFLSRWFTINFLHKSAALLQSQPKHQAFDNDRGPSAAPT
jgi:hypothetical protein